MAVMVHGFMTIEPCIAAIHYPGNTHHYSATNQVLMEKIKQIVKFLIDLITSRLFYSSDLTMLESF